MTKTITKLNGIDDKVLISEECQHAAKSLYNQVVLQLIIMLGPGKKKIKIIYFITASILKLI